MIYSKSLPETKVLYVYVYTRMTCVYICYILWSVECPGKRLLVRIRVNYRIFTIDSCMLCLVAPAKNGLATWHVNKVTPRRRRRRRRRRWEGTEKTKEERKNVRSPRISVRRRKAWHTGISSIANSHRRKRRRRGCAAAAVSLLCVCVFERLETPRDHGSALLRDYWDWVQSLRWSSPTWWWPCAAESIENRGKIRAQQFLLRVRAEGHLAAHAQDCRGVDVRGEQLFPVHVSPLNFPKFTHLSYFIASCTII